jgi:hypothetical protein
MEVRRLKQLDHHRHPQASIFTSTRACDLDAGMVVMGACGHSRLREYVLGGDHENCTVDHERSATDVALTL